MKALVLKGTNDFFYEERDYPELSPESVIVRVEAVCICGSDVGAIRGKQAFFSYPRVIGHEVSGRVHQVGSLVKSLKIGDRVCLMPCIPCNECRACKSGRTNTCEKLRLYGVHEDGGLQEFLSAPECNWLKVESNAAAQEIAMIEPLTIGAHAVEKLNIKPGDRILVVGMGPIGISCAQNAQTYGAEVFFSEKDENRRRHGIERFGYKALDPDCFGYMEKVEKITNGDYFDAVIDTTAAKASMENDWKLIGQGGKIVFVGICNGMLEIMGVPFHMKEPSVYVTRNSTQSDFERVLRFWKLGFLNPGQFITHTTSFENAATILPQWSSVQSDVFKGVVLFDKAE